VLEEWSREQTQALYEAKKELSDLEEEIKTVKALEDSVMEKSFERQKEMALTQTLITTISDLMTTLEEIKAHGDTKAKR
jgi:hypothetical protein